MRITNNTSYIRQQQPGEFRRADDGTGPFSRVNDRKLGSPKEQEDWAVYISNENLVAIKKVTESDFPKLFDFAAGIQPTPERSAPNQKDESIPKNYDNIDKFQMSAKQSWLIDQWV